VSQSWRVNLGVRRGLLAIALLSGVLTLIPAAPALAFTTGPHTEILDDAMSAEGFGDDAIGVTEINNTFMDLYQWVGASANPYSGQGTSTLGRLFTSNLDTEEWPMSVVAAATRSHFDNNPEGIKEGLSRDALMASLGGTPGITAEWERLQRAVWTLLQEARLENNPQKADAVLGASLHEVQDFYAHTNWIEPAKGHGPGADGPGLREQGFGTYPTWFDVPASERDKFTIYGDSTPGHSRTHGYWSTDGNTSLNSGMNKDSPPRPYYLEAAITAYFATRQWVEAARSWVNDDGFWRKMQNLQFTGAKAKDLEEERHDIFEIMLFSGRWEGQGEPVGGPSVSGAAGNLLELRAAIKRYFTEFDKTVFRKEFERLIVRLANRNAPGRVAPVPSSQELQQKLWIVVMRVTRMASVGAFGLGDVWPDQADMYGEMKIDGQSYRSDVIHGENEFSFSNPYEPFTKYKVIPRDKVEEEPVESIEVEVKTADALWAGTDDDVYLHLGNGLRWPLNKRLTNDFERGDDDTYSVPIDSAVRNGLRVGDINQVSLEKGRDGTAGGWKLGGMTLFVNGDKVYEDKGIDKWLGDGNLTWRAKDFVPRDPIGPKIPIWLQLKDDDFTGANYPDPNPYDPLTGSDDQGDVNPYDHRDSVSFGYVPGRKVERSSRGANKLGGRLGFGGDLASVTFTLETLTPELINGSETAALLQPPGHPDLIVAALAEHSVTVRNVGDGAAGFFRLRASSANGEDTQVFGGLAAGALETRVLTGVPSCEPFEATVDDLEQVTESNEANNSARSEELGPICPRRIVVPGVERDSEAVALEKIREAGLIPYSLPEPVSICDDVGIVLAQSPPAGSRVDPDTTVTIRVAARDPNHPCR